MILLIKFIRVLMTGKYVLLKLGSMFTKLPRIMGQSEHTERQVLLLYNLM